MTLYGFRMPVGSICFFKAAITPTTEGLFPKPMNFRFLKPIPCSADIDPQRSVVHSKSHGSMAPSNSFEKALSSTFK